MSKPIITPTEISIAMVDLAQADYAKVLDFIRQRQGNHSTLTPEEKAHRQQSAIVGDLKQLYALVETARLAVLHVNADETEPAAEVLLMASNQLSDLLEVQQLRSRQLKAIAYPEGAEGGANHE
ncbi:hypothetical protein VSS37_09580 [Candidatus Thiothrix sp. Deng01]|uniref:Uncharacterized protein n=1 Tax=Candidatus Thiothrix phosphatis TaxID=3112415 RepID=A0ABU6CWN0_9GAMM|nr:hypothetical protein [Candidatus Thiothrix sp. Deng01]MEB4591226.1 hypothetical protein [Candidatus Thiothrix sp. Deng01]